MGLSIKPKDLIKFLEENGFKEVSIRGSHHKMSNGIRTTEIPLHNTDVKIGLLKGILKQTNLTTKQLEKWLGR